MIVNSQVTIVVVPRERFSYTRESLESIYEHTDFPFQLIYVDGNSPNKVRRYLEAQAKDKGFQLIRTNYYLPTNHARNIGLRQVKTKYVVFIDNDVVVSPGWLKTMVECAEETEATVITPLVCHYEPVHEIVHCAGGEARIWVDKTKGFDRRRFREKMYKQGKLVKDLRDQLLRKQTELAEFHCMMVRTEIFERIGFLDEAMLNTKEHIDFSMTVVQNGGSIYFEPTSIVTYVPGPPLEWTDLHFYMLRWSDAWQVTSLNRLREKWNLAEDGYFKHRYKILQWRREHTLIDPLVRRLTRITSGRGSQRLKNLILPLDRKLNRFLTDRHAKTHQKFIQQQALQDLQKFPTTVLPITENKVTVFASKN